MKKIFKEKMSTIAQASVVAMELHLTTLFKGKEAWLCQNEGSVVWQVGSEEFVGFTVAPGYVFVAYTVADVIIRVDIICEWNKIEAYAVDVNGDEQLLFSIIGDVNKKTEIGKILF